MGLYTHDLGVGDTPCLFTKGSKTHSTSLHDIPTNLITNECGDFLDSWLQLLAEG